MFEFGVVVLVFDVDRMLMFGVFSVILVLKLLNDVWWFVVLVVLMVIMLW